MKIKTPEEYVKSLPTEYVNHIEELRRIIKETLPVVEELISYQVICFKYHYMLVGIGTKKNNCSFYTMSPKLLKKMKSELVGIKHSDSTIYFPLNKELPVDLIKEIVQERMIENEQIADFNEKILT